MKMKMVGSEVATDVSLIMAFVMEGFFDGERGEIADQACRNLSQFYGVGMDAVMRQWVEKVAIPLAVCMNVAIYRDMHFPGVFDYEVSHNAGVELFAAAYKNEMSAVDRLTRWVTPKGKFLLPLEENILFTLLKEFFYPPGVPQALDVEEYLALCERDLAPVETGEESLRHPAPLREALELLQFTCHNLSKEAGWWNSLETGEPLPLTQERAGDKLMLIVTEVAEAKEGFRKDKMDDHLPHRKNAEVELADALIRIFDLAGAAGMDIAGAVVEKLIYNNSREDHKLENRRAEGGKKT